MGQNELVIIGKSDLLHMGFAGTGFMCGAERTCFCGKERPLSNRICRNGVFFLDVREKRDEFKLFRVGFHQELVFSSDLNKGGLFSFLWNPRGAANVSRRDQKNFPL